MSVMRANSQICLDRPLNDSRYRRKIPKDMIEGQTYGQKIRRSLSIDRSTRLQIAVAVGLLHLCGEFFDLLLLVFGHQQQHIGLIDEALEMIEPMAA